MRNVLIAAAAVTALSTGTAFAADMAARPYTKAPVAVAPIYNWTGFYVGAQVGGAWSDNKWDNVTLTGERVSHDKSSVVGGGHIGYNWQFNQFVLGVEAEVNGTDLNATSVSIVNPTVTYGTKIEWYGTVVGRLGFAFNNFLVYGTGGVAFADIKTSGVFTGVDSFGNSSTRTGWTAGGGIAYQITPNWIAGVDYKHIEFDTYGQTGITNTLLLPYTQAGIASKIDQVTARLSYKFGGPVVAKY
jgi:outer membrane immunogenic protein